MGNKGRETPGTSHDPERRQVCRACGGPVGSVMKRHKTLGAYVPLWGPGPCHNPACALHVPEEDESHDGSSAGPAGTTSGEPLGDPPGRTA